MIDAQIARATCQIKCGDEAGTGWLVTPSHVITARHCVDDAIAVGARVGVRFEVDGVAQDITATVVGEDKALDACVLLLERKMDVAPILLDESPPAEGSRFSAFGFPVAKLSVGHRLEGSVSRVLDSPKLGMDLDLQVDAPAALTSYEGISGAALISGDRCQGMLRIAVDKSLGAVSIARMAVFLRQHSIPIGQTPEDEVDQRALASREEFTKVFDSLVSTVAGGYAFIEGAHGIGKSTFCETYQPSLPTLEHFGTYIRVTTPTGTMFEGKEIGRRRKIVSKSWWNKEWLARLLGVTQALQTSRGLIQIGEAGRAVEMQTKPLNWECPVGLDVLALSGMSDLGEEIAQYRSRDDDEDEEDVASAPSAEVSGP